MVLLGGEEVGGVGFGPDENETNERTERYVREGAYGKETPGRVVGLGVGGVGLGALLAAVAGWVQAAWWGWVKRVWEGIKARHTKVRATHGTFSRRGYRSSGYW
eukprot:4364617-Pyramimonas_sp.AAC.1